MEGVRKIGGGGEVRGVRGRTCTQMLGEGNEVSQCQVDVQVVAHLLR